MKKLLGALLLWVSFWFVGLTVVHADTKPLPPDYDPIQGGMVFRPPKELWMKNDDKIVLIPIAYLPGGPIKPSQLSQASYQVKVDGMDVQVQHVTNPSNVLISQSFGLSFGTITTGGLGIVVRAHQADDYQLTIIMNTNQGGNDYETDLVLHVREQISETTWAESSSKSIFSPLPQMVLWHHQDDEVTVEVGTIPTLDNNELQWPLSLAWYFVPPTKLIEFGKSDVTNSIYFGVRLPTQQRQITLGKLTATQQFGLPSINGVQGQPINLNIDYLKPNPGTKLEFVWKFSQTNPDIIAPDIVTLTPNLPANQIQMRSGSLQLVLRYSAANTMIEFFSTPIQYRYYPAAQQSLPPLQTTVSLPAIIQGPVTVNAGLTDWQVNQPSTWHFTMSVSALKQADGTSLQASLKWPNGQLITPTQPYSATYNGQQLLPLSQIDWVFQQQPTVKAGHYQAEIQFQAIAGP